MKKWMTLLMVLAMLVVSVPIPVSAGNDTDIYVSLQGASRPDAGWVIPLTVQLFTPGADVLTATPLYTFTQDTMKLADMAIINVNIEPGIYDVTAKSTHTLMNVKRSVDLTEPTVVDMGTLLEGNAKEVTFDDAAIIDVYDFSVMLKSYGKRVGQVGYNDQADFDRNGIVNSLDNALLQANWNQESPINVP